MMGVPPSGSRSRASHEAAGASSPKASIPNVKLLDYSVAMVLRRNDGTGDSTLSHMIVAAATDADAIGVAMSYVAKARSGEHATKWSAISHASAIEASGQDGETRLHAKHESAVPQGDAQ